MNGLTKLGTILTVVFLLSLLALVAELLYVLWRRQTFRRRTDSHDNYQPTPSKEQLLYLFCWKNHSRIEPASNHHDPASDDAQAAVTAIAACDDDELEKWQQTAYGPSRVLFTIKEEDMTETTTSEAENETAAKSKTVSFDHRQGAESASETELVMVVVTTSEEEGVDNEATPFSTPCASPPYYTPSPSPTHDNHYWPGTGGNR